ncbi:unnamed protein product [Oikopleura dioica]|uniref:E2F/DP family winged-helix DNA-binding domain-containing protein n=1 Tax=Oikopleura dioica TaxID=34765 RepID=E4YDI9_OIKDI|nr:unnamed protein product [Oikopleura dioica]
MSSLSSSIPRPNLSHCSSPRFFTDGDESDNTPNRKADTSLGATAKRFVTLLTSSSEQTIELNEAARRLQAPKRRIYDVTNVLEGIGLVSKKTKNHFQWVGGDVDTENSVENDEQEIANLRKRDAELTQAIEQQEIQLRALTECNDKLGYVTCDDLRSIFRNHLVLCLKAPPDTKVQVPEPSGGEFPYEMLLKSTKGPIDCYLCPEDAQNSTINSSKNTTINLSKKDTTLTTEEDESDVIEPANSSHNDSNGSRFLPFSPLSETDYLFTLDENEGLQNLFDIQ